MKDLRAPTVSELLLGFAGGVLLWLLLSLTTCSPKLSALDRIKALGTLKVATVNSPTTYYVGIGGPTGFEFDLARGFADSLGVKLEMLVMESPDAVVAAVRSGQAHIGAAGVAITPERETQVRFTRPLRKVLPQLVYRQSRQWADPPSTWTGRIGIEDGSLTAAALETLQARVPLLKIDASAGADPEELLYRVAEKKLDFTVANSDLVAIHQRFHSQLRVAFDVAAELQLAWCVPAGDPVLHDAASVYLNNLSGKELDRLQKRYFDATAARVNLYSAEALTEHVKSRLPRYRKAFEQAAKENGLDWRFLAAVGYQESHWVPEAVSPTGVRGIMQITMPTAEFLKLEDRLDPTQSIHAAARYLVHLKAELPPGIQEPDRTWMTLAAYNIGLGHVLDARRLAQMQGGNPNRWADVRNALPLLTQFKWFNQTKYGYARGYEAMVYVTNIRNYQDMLVWITEGRRGKPPEELEDASEAESADDERRKQPLNIESPVL